MPQPLPPKWLVMVLLIAALIGFADSAYLTAEHLRGVIPPCTTNGCEQVLSSSYATLGPIPLAATGVVYYALVIVLVIAYLESGRGKLLQYMSWAVSAGFLATLYFLFVQAFVLHAFCQYCLLSALTTTILFTLSVRYTFSHD